MGRWSRWRWGRSWGTRSGDKGGDANVGVYARSDVGWARLDHELTVARLKELLPETADLVIDRYRFANLRAVNFVIREPLQEGVAASTRQDAQAKAVGEWLRSRIVSVPTALTLDCFSHDAEIDEMLGDRPGVQIARRQIYATTTSTLAPPRVRRSAGVSG